MIQTGHLDGGSSIAADNAGHIYVAWHGASDKADDAETSRRVWLAQSGDDGKKAGKGKKEESETARARPNRKENPPLAVARRDGTRRSRACARRLGLSRDRTIISSAD